MHFFITSTNRLANPVQIQSFVDILPSDQTQGEAWFRPAEESIATGVCLRVEAGHYRVFPYNQLLLAPFEAAVRLFNPVVAVKIRSAAVHAAFNTM
jgi:hypothetical protein